MKNVVRLAIVSISVLSIFLSGCGKLSKKDFESWKEPYVQQNAQEYSTLKNSVSTLDGKVDIQKTSLMESMDRAKNDVTAGYEQGDADTIKASQQFAKTEDAKLREELTKTANMAGEKAQEFAKSEDKKIMTQIDKLEDTTKMQGQSLTKIQASLSDTEREIGAAKATAALKPTLAATVQFPSGSVGLTQAAKKELDKAITAIKAQPDATVMVVGHTDGNPVLDGDYRSNWDLSQARADSVTKYLKAQGVKNKIQSVGRAHTEPVGPVNTEAGKAMNRRAEVIIYPAGTMM